MGSEGLPLRPLDVEHRDVQAAGGGHPGIQLAQGPGGGVPGVGEQGLPPALPLLVQGVEHLFGHIDLPPDDEPGGGVRDAQRDGPDGPQVLRHILPHLAVPPGGPPDEQAVLILQGHRQPIHLGLHVVLRPRDGGADPLVKLAQLVIVEHILKGFQGDLMDHLLEGLQGLPPYPLGGRVGGDELRVLPLQLLQPAQLVVIVVVRHGRGVLDIVFIISLFQLPAQGLELLEMVHGEPPLLL